MINKPLISVCIVTYNHQAYIADCVNSTLAQSGDFSLEIIIGNDASKDDTGKIIQGIKDNYHGEINIRIFHHELNLGPSQNYQFLINVSQGDLIAHLDGDDFWLPGKLQTQLEHLQRNPDCPACYTNAVVINNDKSHWGFFNQIQNNIHITTKNLLRTGNFLNHSSLLYRASNKEKILSFPENFIDYQIHLNLSLIGDLGYINQTLVAYRINSSTSQLRMMKDKVLIMYLEAIVSIKFDISESLFKEGIINFYRMHYINIKINYNKETAESIYNIINKQYPLDILKITKNIVPYAISSEINNFIYKNFFSKRLQFIQNNKITI